MRRLTGVVGVVLGAIVVGFSPARWNDVILTLPRGHGIHLHDVLGMAFIALGIAMLWRSPQQG